MNQDLTPNARALLLLTAPLIVKRGEIAPGLMKPGELNRLVRLLREHEREPGDLLGPESDDLVGRCGEIVGRSRIVDLLDRQGLMEEAVGRWREQGIRVVGRGDPAYPRRFDARLGEGAPPVLYCCGEGALLEGGGLAVVGSRHVSERLLEYAGRVGRLASEAGCTVVSGGARGVDRAAMYGALESGGTAVGVVADHLIRVVTSQDALGPLADGRLTLVSPCDPSAGFNVGNAMGRNKLVYALADAGLVVTSDFRKGGTWGGAIEQLKRLRFVPLFVLDVADAGPGNAALLRGGARPWPDPCDGNELAEALAGANGPYPTETVPEPSLFSAPEEPSYGGDEAVVGSGATTLPIPPPEDVRDVGSAEADLLDAVGRILCRELVEARGEAEVAALLRVSRAQAKEWLARLVERGVLERTYRPAGYRARRGGKEE